MRIMDGVETWDWFSERHGYDFHGTWVADPGGNLAIDPVEPSAEVLARGVARIVLTNRNHFRAAARLQQATGARIAIHPADADFVRARDVAVDDELRPGQRVGPFTIVDAAGKSPGEIALHWPERRLLVVGDACIGKPPGALGLLPAAVIDDRPRLQASLARLADLDFDTLIVGDGAHILSGARAALRALVATFS
jgi:glyoxylase-like metal-dependent hydrolase (beta-lactamase superfamily II)